MIEYRIANSERLRSTGLTYSRSHTRAFVNGPRNFETWSSEVNHTWARSPPPPFPNYHSNGRTFELRTDLSRIAPLHGGSSAARESSSCHAGYELITLTTRLFQRRRQINEIL
ncbi:hypothetical protein TNCV_3503181 [Trichonephila clavipes]|uniref:Uncharacterized protein n=1 Tax=Trichonephila clavipes TaxID=2585209 RepID=A0A8X6V2Q4_TRICX|nr:hypothetical protein TNCV_3503181 [Trichonephila clavipes]